MTIDKKTFRSGPFKDFMAQGTLVGNDLYLSGQVGTDASGRAGGNRWTPFKGNDGADV